jgi:ligand-binding sensor domain-containing protein
VLRFSGGKLTRIPELPPQANDFFPLIEGLVWAVYQDGRILVYDHGAIRKYGTQDGLPEGITRSIVRGANGDLWLAGQGGLARFRNGRFQRADIVPGLHFDALESGDNGFLWLEAGKVLIRISVHEFDRAVADPGYRPAVKTYGNLDGISGVIQAMAKSGDRIWVSTSDGLGYLDLRPHAHTNPLPPPVEIETVTRMTNSSTPLRA